MLMFQFIIKQKIIANDLVCKNNGPCFITFFNLIYGLADVFITADIFIPAVPKK